MKSRFLLPICLLVIFGGLALRVHLARETHEQPIEAAGRTPADEAPDPPPAASLDPPAPFDSPADHLLSRESLNPGEREPASGGRDELFAGSPERPEPGALDGPLVKLAYDDGAPCFEAEQIQDFAGTWVLHGRWTSWFENGQVQEQGWYDQHREAGDWQWWDDNGQRIAQGTFQEGRREGAWTFWYSNGVKQMDARYAGGEGQGLWTLYYDDGQKWAEGQYVEGEISGFWTIWDEFGELNPERTGVYDKGKRISD